MREPHVLNKTKTVRLPKRMVFFDSEAEVDIEITEDEIRRAEEGQEVRKPHRTYLVCATYYDTGTSQRKPLDYSKDYYSDVIKGEPTGGRETFLADFWCDLHTFTKVGEKVYLFAHNAKYDIQVTGGVAYLVSLGWTVVGMSDSNPFILECEYYITHSKRTGAMYGEYKEDAPEDGKEYPENKQPFFVENKGLWFYPKPKVKTLMILSSTNYFAQTLKSLGKNFGLEKLDFDHGQAFTLADALVYCRRDVEILKAAMLGFIDFITRENLGSFSVTVAGQAFGAYRHRFMPEDTIHIHSDERALRVERDAYAGGRTECFYMGEVPKTVFYVDVNSMYPHVMLSEKYPTKLITFWEKGTLDQVRNKLENDYLMCADVLIHTELNIFHKKQKRLIFPTGTYWTSLSTPEIKRGLELGIISEIKNIAIYEGDNIFQPFVQYFYTMRLKAKSVGDDVHDLLYKIFLNSLYGKFGQKNIKYEAVDVADPEEIDYIQIYHRDTKERETFKIFGGKVWKQIEDADDLEAFNSFPAVAAHVTAHARLLLWDAMQTAGAENTYYMDTDSLFCNADGYQRLWLNNELDNGVLGKLKLEDYGTLEIFGVKDYIFTSQLNRDKKTNEFISYTKIKGISKSATKLENSAEGKLRYAVTQWGGFTDRLKNKSFHEFYNKVIIKELKRDYNKGIIEGNKIIPYQLNIIEEETARVHAEQAQLAKHKQMELKEYNEDYILTLCKMHGFMKVLEPNDFYYREYEKINTHNKMKYFRRNRGLPLDEWCEAAGYTVNDLIDLLIYNH